MLWWKDRIRTGHWRFKHFNVIRTTGHTVEHARVLGLQSLHVNCASSFKFKSTTTRLSYTAFQIRIRLIQHNFFCFNLFKYILPRVEDLASRQFHQAGPKTQLNEDTHLHILLETPMFDG